MVVMVIWTTIKRYIFCGSPRKVIPEVGLDGLNLSQPNPQPERNNVTWDHGGPEKRRDPEDQNLRPVRIRRCKSYWSCVLVVNLVNLLVPPFAMQKPVDPIVGVVLHKEIHNQLGRNFPYGWQGNKHQWRYYFDGGIRYELERADDEDEHAHD
nr:hypothetical protein Iba_chr12eCG6510 [Ipomoea batatas]